ncbi:hypothetical protein N7505_007799 [Penicillium chrysogenum]|uniref:Uncharacterized protein n=1 Tax=Penicillium chrysogenum TaxID=5076 RepID=A0ABQ8WEE5_PENCH|nr:hypothetical protein N7505_007799 [Penicillium chrysogenum]
MREATHASKYSIWIAIYEGIEGYLQPWLSERVVGGYGKGLGRNALAPGAPVVLLLPPPPKSKQKLADADGNLSTRSNRRRRPAIQAVVQAGDALDAE